MRTLTSVKFTKLGTRLLTIAIAKASWAHWVRWLTTFGVWMCVATGVNAALKYMEKRIAISVRERLTAKAHEMYLRENNLFLATNSKKELGHLDQRMTSVIRSFSESAALLYGHSFKPVLEFVLSLGEAIHDIGYARPIGLFAITGTIGILFRKLSPPIAQMVTEEEEMEGRFRHAHARLSQHSEEVSFLKGNAREQEILDDVFSQNMQLRTANAITMLRKSIMDNILKFQNLLWGGVFIHVPFLQRPHLSESERIAGFRSTELLMLNCGGAFTEIMLLGKSIEKIAGYTESIAELFEFFGRPQGAADGVRRYTTDRCIALEDLDLSLNEAQSTRMLLRGLTMTVRQGDHTMITGPNGSGKTSLFRVIAGLWPAQSGAVGCPSSGIMWVPQRPYLVMGTLRDQVTYPLHLDSTRDDEVEACLEQAGLGKLRRSACGLDQQYEEWNAVLSGGERQRIGFARVYFHKPMFAVLDEATSAINPDVEQKLYQGVIDCGTTVMSIAHRLELRSLHKYELTLKADGNGSWEHSALH